MASCWNETSPTRSVAGRPKPAANPAAALKTPSMPLAPRFAAVGAPGPNGTEPRTSTTSSRVFAIPANASTSRMGMELPKNKPMDRGNASATASATPISVMPSSFSRSRSARRASRAAAASAASSASRNDAQDAKFEDARYDPPFVSLNPSAVDSAAVAVAASAETCVETQCAGSARASWGVTTAQAAPPSSAAASSAVCTRLDVRRGLTCTMTSGLKNARIDAEHSETSATFRTCGQNAAGSPPPARTPLAASATTAHPRPAASSVAASAAAAPSDAPPAITSTPRRADRTSRASAATPAASLAAARDSPSWTPPPSAAPPAKESGATRDSHPSKPRRSRSGFHGAGTGPRGSRNWQFKCTGPGRAPRRTRVAAFAAVAQTRAGAPSPGGGRSASKRAKDPKIFVWSMVWFAPEPLSSGGLSAVSSRSGELLSAASTAAGSRLATAVPLLVMTAAPAAPAPAPLPTPSA